MTLPLGVLADRVRRAPLLAASVALWAVAMLLSAAASSFDELLIARLFLGVTTAASAPLVASLVGDLFRRDERGYVYGYILAGELGGTLLGLIVSGNLAVVSWRLALCVLALPSMAVATVLWRSLPEPSRGGASQLAPSAVRVPPGHHSRAERARRTPPLSQPRDAAVGWPAVRVRAAPRPALILEDDPRTMSICQAVRYVLRVPTNSLLIIASSLGYFFQADINTFGIVFIVAHFAVTQSEATFLLALAACGALAGTVLGGRVADWLLSRGYVAARVFVGGAGFLISSIVFLPGILSRTLLVGLPLYAIAAVALAVPNAAVDAARLDNRPWSAVGTR